MKQVGNFRMKKNRIFSYIIILLVYILAFTIGIIVYKNIDYSFWLNLLIADIVATIVVFIFSLILNNASVYDPYWSVQPIVIVWGVLLCNNLKLSGLLFSIVITLWGLRLTINWAYTFKNLYTQDWRYVMLKEKTKAFYPIINFIGIHMVPTLVVYCCVLPACYVIKNQVSINILMIIFLIISITAFTIQGLADNQMHRFKKQKRSGFIRDGLWKYSRHPNYFGEILMWWGIGLASIFSLPSHIYLILGAVFNTLLFLFVSIPMADKRNEKRGDMVKLKKETRMLLPIKK